MCKNSVAYKVAPNIFDHLRRDVELASWGKLHYLSLHESKVGKQVGKVNTSRSNVGSMRHGKA
jgi:hypothetical protein